MIKIKIAIVDDHKLFREALKVLLAYQEDIEVVLEVDNGAKLIENLEACKPDVIMMDLNMPAMNGIEATKFIRLTDSPVKIVVMTIHDDEQLIMHLMEHGANAYLKKTDDPKEVIKAIHIVYQEGYFFNKLVNNAVFNNLERNAELKPSFQRRQLTKRQLDTLRSLIKEEWY